MKNTFEKQYLNIMQNILDNGTNISDRTGVGTLRLINQDITIENIENEFPLMTTKKMFYKGIIHELLWFIDGDTNIKYLNENGVKFWNEWPFENYLKNNNIKLEKYSNEWQEKLKWFGQEIVDNYSFACQYGSIGPAYGKQLRYLYKQDGTKIDQLSNVIKEIKTNPYSRRLIITLWNPVEMDECLLPCCHGSFIQFFVENNTLSMYSRQRSGDWFLGVPFNYFSYSLLLMMIAQVCDLKVGNITYSVGDAHIYKNHIEQCKEQLNRNILSYSQIELNENIKNIFDFKFNDIKLINYISHPEIKAPIAV